MAKQSLYIQVPQMRNSKSVKKTLEKYFSLSDQSSIHITWILSCPGLYSLSWIKLSLKKLKSNGIKGLISNTIEFSESKTWKAIPFIIAFHRYCFRYIFHTSSIDYRHGMAEKLMRKLKVIHYYRLDETSQDSIDRWLRSAYEEPTEPYIDLLKICRSTDPVTCYYNSCLGKTLYISGVGDIAICPYHKSDIQLNALESCSSLPEVYDTKSFRTLLFEQINKRNECKNNCSFYKGCKGGCPLIEQATCIDMPLLQSLKEKIEADDSQSINQAIYEERARALSLRFRV